jgi:hypothetical protein
MRIVFKNKLDKNRKLDKENEILREESPDLEAELKAELEEFEERFNEDMQEMLETVTEEVATIVEEVVRKEIAANMLFELNLDMKIVQKATGLTKKDLQDLVKQISE